MRAPKGCPRDHLRLCGRTTSGLAKYKKAHEHEERSCAECQERHAPKADNEEATR